MDTGEIVIGVGGVAMSCLSLIAGYQIARRSGDFDKHDLRLRLWGQPPLANGFLCMVLLGDDAALGARKYTWLRVGLVNGGRREAANVELTIQCGRPGSIGETPVSAQYSGPQLPSLSTERAVRADKGFTYIAHSVKAIRPGVGLDLLEPIPVQVGLSRGTAAATTKDGVAVEVPYELAWTVPVRIAVVFSDREPISSEFSITGVPASDVAGAVEFAAKHYDAHTEFVVLRPEWKPEGGVIVGEVAEISVVRRS